MPYLIYLSRASAGVDLNMIMNKKKIRLPLPSRNSNTRSCIEDDYMHIRVPQSNSKGNENGYARCFKIDRHSPNNYKTQVTVDGVHCSQHRQQIGLEFWSGDCIPKDAARTDHPQNVEGIVLKGVLYDQSLWRSLGEVFIQQGQSSGLNDNDDDKLDPSNIF